jgi:tetratricopeptide (TPR) repeat protein
LEEAETTQLVTDRLAGEVDGPVLRAVHQTAEGNALFAEQLLRAWREEGIIRQKEGRWQLSAAEQPQPLPRSLRQTIQSRVNRLSSEEQEVLRLAAVAGREFPYRWLAEAGTWPESTLLQRLDRALQAGILEEVAQRAGPLLYRFQHGLLRQALYESLSEARRRYLHLQLAETLEDKPEVPAGVRSHHWFAAGRWPWAFCYALTAAGEALRAFAHTEAVSLYDRALAAARGGWQVESQWLAQAHTGRAQALMGLNRFNDAVSDWQWLVEQARAAGDRVAEGQALSQMAAAHFWGHHLDSARQHAQEALSIARETGDTTTATMCTSNLGCIALCTGELRQGARQLEEVLQHSRELGDPRMIVEALACLPGAYHWQGDSDRALPLLEKGIDLAREEGLGFWLGNLLFFAGLAHGGLGHYERALDYFKQGQRHSQESGDMFTAVRVANCFGWIHHELYDLETAVEWDQRGVEMAREFPWPEPLANALVNLGADYLAVGEPAQAEEAFAEAESLLEVEEWMRWRWHTRLLVSQGRLALTRGDLQAAEEHGQEALALARETSARKNLARARHLLGKVYLAAGEADQATSQLRQAVEFARDVTNPRLHWQSLDALARAYRELGGEEKAVQLWSQAAAEIQDTAAGLASEQLRRTFLQATPIRSIRERPAQE